MSRAFVKEDSDAPSPPPLERPVSSAPNLVTSRGLRLIAEEIGRLERAIADAGGDEEAAANLRRDLRYWSMRSASAQPVETDAEPHAVGFGTRVVICRGGRTSAIEIVGEDEADPGKGRIAWTSPIAQAIDGAEVGDSVPFETGGRSEAIDIVAVTRGEDAGSAPA